MTIRNSLFRRLLVLGFLLGALVLFSNIVDQTATVRAAPCCEDCEEGLYQCLDTCGALPSEEQSGCYAQCFQANNNCISPCITCGAPIGSATECDWSYHSTSTGYCWEATCTGLITIHYQTGGCD